MIQISDPTQLHDILARFKAKGKTIGFAPTMGALHEGHLSLVRKSKKENDVTVVSIFVNPTQFGPKEDLSKYPRPLKKDLALLRKAKVDFVFTPTVQGMYPERGDGSCVSAFGGKGCEEPSLGVMKAALPLTRNLCGKFRPGHFKGVMIVVWKLFKIVQPTRAYFGAKDYQQAAVIQKMNEGLCKRGQVLSDDLSPFEPIKICVEPTVREKDGLAMSSRNQYLSPEERKRALAISQVLLGLRKRLGQGKINLKNEIYAAQRKLANAVDQLQYLEVVDPLTLKPLKKIQKKMVAVTACYVGKTRLIDNVIIELPRESRR